MTTISPYLDQVEQYQSLQSRWDIEFGGGSMIQTYLSQRDRLLAQQGQIIPELPKGLDKDAQERFAQEVREKINLVMPQILKSLEDAFQNKSAAVIKPSQQISNLQLQPLA